MAVFGKGRVERKNNSFFEESIEIRRERKKGKIVRKTAAMPGWIIENSDISEIEKNLHFGIRDFLKERIERQGSAAVLDWGCGKAVAIDQIAKEFGGKINAYGCSDLAYRKWQEITSAKLIHATKNDIPRYLKDKSFDLIYSHFGLTILQDPEYIKKLALKLKPNGKLVTTTKVIFWPENIIQKINGHDFRIKFNLKTQGDPVVEITRLN